MTIDEKAKIIIIEDDRDLNNLLKYSLETSQDFLVYSYFDGLGAYEKILEIKPVLILLDIMLPHKSGTDILKELRSNPDLTNTFVILLTARSQESDKIDGFEAGADDYITKPFSPRELVLRVHAFLRRSGTLQAHKTSLLSPLASSAIRSDSFLPLLNQNKILTAGPIKIYTDEFKVTVQNKIVPLTVTEYQLLSFLVERIGKLQSRELLLQKVWGYEGHINTRTVDTHIKRLRQKLGHAGALIETVHGFGYQLNEG